jgi:hypothetical protein
MKSLTWIVFTVIFIFSAIYVFKHEKYTKRVGNLNGYCVNFSVERGQDIEFFINPQINHKKGIICIYDTHKKIIDSLITEVRAEEEINDTMLYEHGYQYKNKYIYNTKRLPSGLYFIDNTIPFIVRDCNLKNSITVVFPFANLIAISNDGGKSFSEGNSSYGVPANKLSLHRNPQLGKETRSFFQWIDSMKFDSSINYISDLDLDENVNLKNTKLLILNGYSAFWSAKQRECFEEYINQGGEVLAICSRLMNNKMNYNSAEFSLYFKEPEKGDTSINNQVVWNKILSNTKAIGCSYELFQEVNKAIPSYGGYKILSKNHPVFNNINDTFIPINTENGNAITVVNSDFTKIPIVNAKDLDFYKSEILAYDLGIFNNGQTVTGIFYFQKKKESGNIIIIGNDNWLLKENLNRSLISRITANCINYLVKI